MGTGYTRNDTANNIADGNVINAADFDGEYDAIEAAFNATTGHTHDGTAAEGGPITVVGPVQDVVVSSTEMRPKTTNTLDLGTSSLEYKDLHLAGTANLVNATTTGDITLTGAAYNVVFDASDNALEFGDNAKAVFGDSDDLQVYHNGTTNYVYALADININANTGVNIQAKNGEDSIVAVADGAVELYHDNSKKFETTATGVTVTGSLAVDSLHLDDSEKLTFGNSVSPDLEMYHDGSNSFISDIGTGSLVISSNDLKIQNAANNEILAQFTQDGTATLLYDNSTKLATDADGVDITGQLDVSTDVNITSNLDVGDDVTLSSDSAVINLGAGSEVNITHVADTGVTLNVENSTTNAVTDVLKLQAQSSGTPAVGIGTGVEFSTETASDNLEIGGVIESSASGLTPTSEEFDMIFKTMSTGTAAAERLKLNGSGATVGNVNVDGNTVSSTDTNGDINLSPNGTGTVVINTDLDVDNINIDGNAITSTDANGNIALTPNGTGEVDITKVDIDSGAIDGITLGTNSAVTEAQIDNINIDGNAITSTDTNGNIALTPNGTGEVDISKVDIDAGAIDGVTIGTNSAVTELQVDNLNVNGNSIVSTNTNGNITLTPAGTGNVDVGVFTFDADQSIGAGQDNYVLTYDNTGGTIQLEALPGTSISSDTSPALGGTLTADGFNIEFDDSGAATDDRLRFGTGNDLEIYHDGTDSIIDNATSEGSIKIQDTSSTVLEIGADEVTVTGRALSTDGTNAVTAVTETGSPLVATLDLSSNTNFSLAPSASNDFELTFSNVVAGQSGNIKLDNSNGVAITANAVVAMNASALTAIQTAGVYHLAYYTVGTSGTSDVLLSVSGSLTSQGV
jgi:hypothetical protein